MCFIQEVLLSCELVAFIPQAPNADFSAASVVKLLKKTAVVLDLSRRLQERHSDVKTNGG